MFRYRQRHLHRFISSLFLTLLFLSYLPARAANDRTQPPTRPPYQPQQQVQPAPKRTGYLSEAKAGDPLQIAMDYLRAHRFELGLTADDLADVVVKDRYISQNNGVTHLYLRQRLNGIELFNGDININVMEDGRILNLGNRFVSDLRSRVKQTAPGLDAVSAVRSVANQLRLPVTQALVATTAARGQDRAAEVSSGGFSVASIPVRLIYQALDGGHVQLAWNMTIQPINSSDWLDIRADAVTGNILSTVNWTSEAATDQHQVINQPNLESAPEAPSAGIAADSYLVYPLPFESPFDGSQTAVSNPADPTASPFGWHDTDGVAGPEFTTTRGNNTFTYADLASPDGFSTGDVTTEGGASLSFTYTAHLSQPPAANQDAAITNLFYVTNRVHDILYHNGFDEVSGNFQANNYGRGGLGNDSVKAEAQDYSGVNNANFSTPPDGFLPRMQMYLGGVATQIEVTAPPSIAGEKDSVGANFGPAEFDVSADIVLVDDGQTTTSDGCETPFSNAAALAGKIALIDRGTCNFVTKVKNAQSNGAIGVIIANNAVGLPPSFSGTDASITIPSRGISQADGNAIKAELGSTVTVSMSGAQRDGSLDNGVIIHEYGHGLSNRLTGGPSNVSCLDTQESGGMGEGWSDFLALVLTAKESQTATTAIPVGRWLLGDPSSGAGIRRAPYTTDMNVNSLTFASTSLSDEVHNVGEIWATMLWEVYWNLVDDYGFDADLINGNGGNRLALQLVIDGMKLQPCAPTFVDARDAILVADLVNTDGVNQCRIWEGFAKRGLGYSATAGDSSNAQDGTEAFELPDSCMVDVQPAVLNACIPNDAVFDIALGDSFEGSATLSEDNVPAGATSSITPNSISAPTHASLTIGNTGVLTPGSYAIDVIGTGNSQVHTTTVQLNLATAAPSAPLLTLPVDQDTDVSDDPYFKWDAMPQASHYLFELAEDADFASLIYTSTTSSNSMWLPYFLRSARTYYWRVAAQNGCGENVSEIASFTVRIFPSVLLVDDDSDDSSFDMAPYFGYALSELNVDYDYWDTGNSGTGEPTRLDDIADYSTIIWFDGFVGAGPEPQTEPILAQFLDEGKCFYISAHDYYISRGLTSFMHDYLGVEAVTDDLSDGMSWHSVITGTAPIFDDLGPYTMLFPQDNYSDLITPTVSAGVAFVGNAGNAAVYKDAGNYRTTYWGFEYENLPTDNALIETMARVLDFCTFQTDLGIEQSVTPHGTVKPGQPISYTLTYSNSGVATAESVLITATLPTQLVNLAVISEGATITSTGAAPYTWQVDDLAPGQTGVITVSGVVSTQLTADTFLHFQAAIGGQNFDQQSSNNSTTTLTDTVVVPRIQLASTTTTVDEGAGSATITVSLDQANPFAPAQVHISSSDDTAQAGSDFGALNSDVVVAAGAVTATVAVSITDDSEIEMTEQFTVALSSSLGAAMGAQQNAQVTITDHDLPAISFTEANFYAVETKTTATVEVSLDKPHPYYTVTVDYSSSDGTALSGLDYTSVSGKLIFPAGSTTTTLTIDIADDGIVESSETFHLTLSSPTSATLGTQPTTTVTIRDRDLPVISFVEVNYTKSEGDGEAAIALELNQPNLTDVVSVTYSTSDDSATAGSDYLATSGVLTFAIGSTSGSVTIPLLDDNDVEQAEDLQISLLSATNGTLDGPSQAVVTLTDNDQPVVSFANATQTTAEASGNYSITLELDRPQPFQSVSVVVQSDDVTAISGSDYEEVDQVITFPAGKTSVTFAVNVLEDTIVEVDESLLMTLTNPSGVALGTLIGSMLIITDSDLPVVSFASASYSTTEDSGLVTATIVLDQPNPRDAVIVGYATADNSAQAGSDYTAVSDTVTIPAGATSTSIVVALSNDDEVEGEEQFFLEQTSLENALPGSPDSAVIKIANDDLLPKPKLLANLSATPPSGQTVYIGDEIRYTLSISNSGGPASNLVVTVTVPSNTIYLSGSSTPGPEIAPGAASRARNEQMLVWRISSLAAGEQFSVTYALRVVAISDTLQSAVTITADGELVSIGDAVTYTVEESRRIFLPLVNR